MLPLTSTWSPGITSLYLGCKQISKARRLGASQVWRGLSEGRKLLGVSCSSCGDGELGENQEDQTGWSVEGQVDKILGDDALMQDLNAAVERVAKARRELEALEEQEKQSSFSENLNSVNSLVEACQRDVFAAELDLKNAEVALVKARAGMVNILGEETFFIDAERLESAKAAGVCGMVGFLAGLPFFSLARDLNSIEMAVSAVIILVSCAVFGLTYRYAIRRDLSNTQLRAGCIAAFVLVRCLAEVDAVRLFAGFPQQDIAQPLLQGCIFAAESIAVFSFAAVGLEYCFQQGIAAVSFAAPGNYVGSGRGPSTIGGRDYLGCFVGSSSVKVSPNFSQSTNEGIQSADCSGVDAVEAVEEPMPAVSVVDTTVFAVTSLGAQGVQELILRHKLYARRWVGWIGNLPPF